MGVVESKLKRKLTSKKSSAENSRIEYPSTKGSATIVIEGREFNRGLPNEYVLPRDNEEADRLHIQYFSVKELYDNNLVHAAPKALLESGKELNVIDIGCGPGTWSLDVAKEYPNTQVTGFDISDVFPKEIRPPNVNFLVANALDRFPFDDNSIHIANIRIISIAISVEDWGHVLKETYRVLVPGGYLNMLDMNIYFEGNETVMKYDELIEKLFAKRGVEIGYAAKLGGRIKEAGFDLVETDHRGIDMGANNKLSNALLWDAASGFKAAGPLAWRIGGLKSLEKYIEFVDDVIKAMKESHTIMNFCGYVGQKP